MLKYSIVIVDLSVSPYSSIHFCFVNIEYILQAYTSLMLLLYISSKLDLIPAFILLYYNY